MILRNLTFSVSLLLAASAMGAMGNDSFRMPIDFEGSDGVRREITLRPGHTVIDHNALTPEQRVRHSAPIQSGSSTNAATHTLTVKIDPDANGGNTEPYGVWCIQDSYVGWASYFNSDNTFEVPEGEYLIQAVFNGKDATSVIFLPDVKVSGTTEVHLSADMATTTVTPRFLLPDGSPAQLPDPYNPDATPANVNSIFCISEVTYHGLSKCSNMFQIDNGGASYEKLLSLRTNLKPGEGEYFWGLNVLSADKKIYSSFINAASDDVNDGMIVSNCTEDFYKVEPTLAHTPAYTEYGNGYDGKKIVYYVCNNEGSLLMGTSGEVQGSYEIYGCGAPLDPQAVPGIHGMIQVTQFDYYDPDNYVMSGVSTPFICNSTNGLLYGATQIGSIYAYPDKPEKQRFPINYNCSMPLVDEVLLGSTAATCVTFKQHIEWDDIPYSYVGLANYYGTYGEPRAIDCIMAGNSIRYNGEEVDLSKYPSISSWASAWARDKHEPGILTYVFHNENIEVDGQKGFNHCEVSYNEANIDQEPPTLQRLMFRNLAGVFTNRFASAEEVNFLATGGDFTFNKEPRDMGEYVMDCSYYTYAPAQIKVEYAPTGTEDFIMASVEEQEDGFFMPGFGALWTGSLNVNGTPAKDGWYDVRVTLTDEAGNTQVQTVSPAFLIGAENPAVNTSVVRDIPEDARTSVYERTSTGYHFHNQQIMKFSTYGVFSTFSECENGDVYLKNPITYLPTGNYIKGSRTGNVFSFELPQTISYNEEKGFGYNVTLMTPVYGDDGSGNQIVTAYLPVQSENVARFICEADGSIRLDLPEGYLLGATYIHQDSDFNGNWAGYGDLTDVYTPFSEVATSIPADASIEKWAMIHPKGGRFIDVAVKDDKIYIAGTYSNLPDACVVGTIVGDEVTFESGQFLGYDEAMGYFFYNVFGECVSMINPWSQEESITLGSYIYDTVTYKYDADAKTLLLPGDTERFAWVVNVGTDKIYAQSFMYDVTFKYQPIVPQTPQNPRIDGYQAFMPSVGYGDLFFTLPLYGEDGYLLVADNYTFSLYKDGQIIEITPEEGGVPKSVFDFGKIDTRIYASGEVHTYFFLEDGFTTLGVQSFYECDGEKRSSQVVTYNVETGEVSYGDVSVVNATEATIKDIRYYDIQGNELPSAPDCGIYIERTVYSNGIGKIEKKMAR